MPPLNQSLWTLLIASLIAVAGWGVVYLSALVERERQERHTERDGFTTNSGFALGAEAPMIATDAK